MSDNIQRKSIGQLLSLRKAASTWLREAMKAAGYSSQGALAEMAGVNRETVHNLLAMKVDPEEETVAKLARACRVPAPRIVFDTSGGPVGPSTASGWVAEAQAALAAADRLILQDAARLQELEIQAAVRAHEAFRAVASAEKRGKGNRKKAG
ncbi:MAG: helix-turn-helix transcriptional regulator [Gemmatimonadales bacterium]|nr:helix-turn-helix transcriptional regulator [Gemmatimonadales bacterium]